MPEFETLRTRGREVAYFDAGLMKDIEIYYTERSLLVTLKPTCSNFDWNQACKLYEVSHEIGAPGSRLKHAQEHHDIMPLAASVSGPCVSSVQVKCGLCEWTPCGLTLQGKGVHTQNHSHITPRRARGLLSTV